MSGTVISNGATAFGKSRRRRIRIYLYNLWRRRLRYAPRIRLLLLLAALAGAAGLVAYTAFWVFHHLQCYHREYGVDWFEAPIHDLPRPCPAPPYTTLLARDAPPEVAAPDAPKPRICLTTLTDRRSPSWLQRRLRCRDFDAVGDIAFPNQRAYARRHGYLWVDASPLVDPARPPAWSKIRAVQALLAQRLDGDGDDRPGRPSHGSAPACDWVVWLDADVLIMNANVRIESVLPAPGDPGNDAISLIATHDRKYTANSGVWIVRNAPWAHQFLEDWWNLKSWVRRPGLSLSGDNAAFGHLVDRHLAAAEPEPRRRVRIIPRCNLNSFGVFLTRDQHARLASGADALAAQDWYLSERFYHRGDFIVHASGIDKKKEVLELLIRKAVV